MKIITSSLFFLVIVTGTPFPAAKPMLKKIEPDTINQKSIQYNYCQAICSMIEFNALYLKQPSAYLTNFISLCRNLIDLEIQKPFVMDGIFSMNDVNQIAHVLKKYESAHSFFCTRFDIFNINHALCQITQCIAFLDTLTGYQEDPWYQEHQKLIKAIKENLLGFKIAFFFNIAAHNPSSAANPGALQNPFDKLV